MFGQSRDAADMQERVVSTKFDRQWDFPKASMGVLAALSWTIGSRNVEV